MEDVGKHTDRIQEFRAKAQEVAARVIEDALKAPTARERTQAARLVFDVLGFLGGARSAQVSVQAHGSTHMLTDELVLEQVDVRVTGIDPSEASDVGQVVRGLGFGTRSETLHGWEREQAAGNDPESAGAA